MRIALIWHRLGPYHMARLRAAGKIADIVVVEMSGADQTYAWDKVEGQDGFERLTLYPDRDCNTMPRGDIRRQVFAALDRTQPDVVAIPGWSEIFALSALQWCALRKVRSILMSPSTARDFERRAWKESIKRRLVGLFQAGLGGGEESREYMEYFGMPKDRILLGYDAIDNDYFSNWQESPEQAASDNLPTNYFMATARFVPLKNFTFLIDAYAAYRQRAKGDPWSLVILGDGETRAALEEQRRHLELEPYVMMPGFIQYPDLPRYYHHSSALILPSWRETWGLVVNEAMACGKPVLVSNRCGCATTLVMHGRNGYIFDPYNREELTGLMCRLANGEDDLAAMGQASREIIARWSPTTFAENLRKVAEFTMERPRPKLKLVDRLLLETLIRMR